MGDISLELEKLAQLHSSGVLTRAEFEAAKQRVLTGDAGVQGPTNTVTCVSCQSREPLGRRYCGVCGALLVKACPFCEAENDIGTRYCRECGSDTQRSPAPGLPLSQAREWRERFRGIGWWDSPYDSVWPTVPALADQLARLHFSTDLDDLDSYWIFCCRIVKRDFGIKEVKVNKRAVDVGWRQDPVQYLVGTRQSIIFFNLNRPEAAVGRIADLLAIDCSGDRYRLQFKNVMLEFAVAAKGASLGNILMAMGEDPGVKVIADRNIREQNSALGRFQSTLRSFLHDVATGAGARWRG